MCVFGVVETHISLLCQLKAQEHAHPVAVSTPAPKSWPLIPFSKERNQDLRRNGSHMGKEVHEMTTSALYHCSHLPEHIVLV